MKCAGAILSFPIDGLNLKDQPFQCNEILFFSSGVVKENFASASVVIPKRQDLDIEDLFENPFAVASYLAQGEALQIISLFLASYYLSNITSMPIVMKSASVIMSLTSLDNVFETYSRGGVGIPSDSTRQKISQEKTIENLKNALPLFQKIFSISKQKSKKGKENPLTVSLLFYQRAMERGDFLKDFIDLVTSIEALLGDSKGELRFKFAMRSAIFTEPDSSKVKDRYNFLKDVYDARSDLIHGTDIRLDIGSDYFVLKNKLEPIAKDVILNYINLVSQGKDKLAIIDYIDDKLLGSKNV